MNTPMKNSDVFLFLHKPDCGYLIEQTESVLTSTHNLCLNKTIGSSYKYPHFMFERKKNNVHHFKPQLLYEPYHGKTCFLHMRKKVQISCAIITQLISTIGI